MDEFIIKFGKRVREYREILGYSQEKLAELADVSTNTINSIENGKTFVKYSTLKKLSSALNILAGDLFNFEVDKEIPDKLLHQIIIYSKNLTPSQQKQVIEILKTFKC